MKKILIYVSVVFISALTLLFIINPKIQQKSFVVCSDRQEDYEETLSLVKGEKLSSVNPDRAFDCEFGGQNEINVTYIQRIR